MLAENIVPELALSIVGLNQRDSEMSSSNAALVKETRDMCLPFGVCIWVINGNIDGHIHLERLQLSTRL